MRVVVKEPERPAEVRDIPNTLEAFQGIVGGYIQVVPFPGGDGRLLLVCNEEGKLDGLPVNIRLGADIIVGTLFVCRSTGEEFEGLTETEADEVAELLGR